MEDKAMFFFILPDEPFLHLVPCETLTPAEYPDGLKSTITEIKYFNKQINILFFIIGINIHVLNS